MRYAFLFALLALAPVSEAPAQKKKPPMKEGPRALMALPLGVPVGATTRITLRGLKLDGATGVRFPGSKITGKVLAKGNAAVPAQLEPARVGNTQVEVAVTVPAGTVAGLAEVIVTTAGGDSAPYRLFIDATAAVPEKEPNNGFGMAQRIELGRVVQGAIGQAQDVDTYRFEGKAGQQVVLEVFAARHGSALDSILALYDESGQKVAEHDDLADSVDSRLEVTLPRTGAYFVTVLDAHDQGGPTHVYRLVVRLK